MRLLPLAVFALAAVLPAAAGASSGNIGGATAQFLRLGAGPRALGMGDAYTAVAEGPEAVYWNPAGLAQSDSTEVTYARTEFLSYFHHDFVALSQPIRSKNSALGFAFTHFSQRSMMAVDKDNVQTGEFSPRSFAFSGAFAHTFGEDIGDSWTGRLRSYECGGTSPWAGLKGRCRPVWGRSGYGPLMLGVAGKYIQESLYARSARAFAFDLGALYKPAMLEGSSLGLALRNLGTKEKFIQEAENLPMEMDIGAAYMHSWDDADLRPAVMLSLPYYGLPSAQAGVEYSKVLTEGARGSLRFGFKSLTAGDLGLFSGFTFGIGLEIVRVRIDFACQTAAELGQTYRMGLSWRWADSYESPAYREPDPYSPDFRLR